MYSNANTIMWHVGVGFITMLHLKLTNNENADIKLSVHDKFLE